MLRLTLLMYTILGTTLAGIGVVIALSMGMYDVMPIVGTALAGAIVALPVSYFVAKQLKEL